MMEQQMKEGVGREVMPNAIPSKAKAWASGCCEVAAKCIKEMGIEGTMAMLIGARDLRVRSPGRRSRFRVFYIQELFFAFLFFPSCSCSLADGRGFLRAVRVRKGMPILPCASLRRGIMLYPFFASWCFGFPHGHKNAQPCCSRTAFCLPLPQFGTSGRNPSAAMSRNSVTPSAP